MTGSAPGRLLARHLKWIVGLAVALACALSAAPASAIMVKLPRGGYANYEALSGSKAPAVAKRFDAMFSNLDYSGGPIMPSNTNYIVEWQPSNYTGTAFQDNSGGSTGTYAFDYVGGIQKFMQDMAADSGQTTNSDAVSTQYNDTSGAHSSYSFGYAGTLIDTDPLPPSGCSSATICLTDAQFQAELNSFLSSRGVPADLTHEYFVLTPPDIASCFDASGSAGCSGNASANQAYCAYHSQTGAGYVYANIPDVSGINGCDPFVTTCLNFACDYNNGPGDGVLSAVSHEHNESITDPQPNNAWTDWQACGSGAPMTCGGEIGDKCNDDGMSDSNLIEQTNGFTDTPYNETIGGDHYLIQMEWSNQGKGCFDSFSANGTSAAASFTQSGAGGNSVSFNAGASTSTPGGVAQYVWQFNDNSSGIQNTTIETSSPTISHTFPGAGTYTVALTVMNTDGTSNGAAHTISVGGLPPTAAFTGSNGSENVPITFDGRSSTDPNPGGSLTYAWNFGDGHTASGAVVSHGFQAGGYTVTLTVTDSASGQTSAASHAVSIADEGPTAAFNPPSGTANHGVAFSGSGSDPDGSISAYSWSFGDGQNATGATPSHTYSAPGTYTVTLTVTDSNGQMGSVSRSVTINPAPARCVVPKLKGDTLSRARTLLSQAHCSVGRVTSPKKPKRSPGKHKKWVLVVGSQSPGAGSSEPAGDRVKLTMVWKPVHK